MKTEFFLIFNELGCMGLASRHADGQPRCGGGLRVGAATPTSNTGGLKLAQVVQ